MSRKSKKRKGGRKHKRVRKRAKVRRNMNLMKLEVYVWGHKNARRIKNDLIRNHRDRISFIRLSRHKAGGDSVE